MKRTFGIAMTVAFLFAAAAVHAQTASKPLENIQAPTVKKVEAAPAVKPAEGVPAKAIEKKDPTADATEVCKRKGLAGNALDECVKVELAKGENTPKMAIPVPEKPVTK